jgi:hypothetical protein
MQNDWRNLVHFQEESKQRPLFAYSRSTFKALCGDLDKMGANLPLKKKENCDKNQFLLSKEKVKIRKITISRLC